ncbi:CPBP family intramembrane glutamic endopeptidase [Ekhidna sp.]|uniref:CPBP family intramembrane glutamic endopeptidase n=1 Tax=Ekhidna sp. TaxID=2608089 RepID=UPI003B500698
MKTLSRLYLILEVIGLFVVGSLLGRLLSKLLNLNEWLSQGSDLIQMPEIDFIRLASISSVGSLIKYGCIFLLVIVFIVARRVPMKTGLGLSRSKKSILEQIKISLFVFCLIGLIPKVLFGLWPYGLVGSGPSHWHILNGEWNFGFWIYMLASSIIIPPIVEELFFRGFTLSRFKDGFNYGYAILLMAIMFSTFHTQYFQLTTISILSLISLFLGSIIFGYIKYYTGSILPCFIAHALANIPIIGIPSLVLSGLMLLVVISRWQVIVEHARALKTLFSP